MARIKYFIALLILLITVPAFGATYHITQSGAGAQTGADEANADTVAEFNADNINDGATGMAAGDTIYFYGTITTGIVPPVSGESGNHIVLDGYAADDTTFMNLEETKDGGRAKVDINLTTDYSMYLTSRNYITVQDFEATNLGHFFYIYNSHDILIKRNFMCYYLYLCKKKDNRSWKEKDFRR